MNISLTDLNSPTKTTDRQLNFYLAYMVFIAMLNIGGVINGTSEDSLVLPVDSIKELKLDDLLK